MSINKVIFGDETLIDLTSDTVKPSLLMSGITAHNSAGTSITGTIIARTASDVGVAGPTVSVPSGAYSSAVTKTVASGSVKVNSVVAVKQPSISFNSAIGVLSASNTGSTTIGAAVTSGYVTSATNGTITFSGSSTYALPTIPAATITPTESSQVAAASGKFTLGNITVAAVSSDYIGSNIPQRSSSDIAVAGPTVSIPSGMYGTAVSTTIPEAVLNTYFSLSLNNLNYSLNSSTGLLSISGAVSKNDSSVHYSSGAGYASYVNNNIKIHTTVASTYQLPTQAAATITPTESVQTAAQSGKFLTGNITVGAISSDYIGSNIAQRSSGDLTVSGATVTAPAGYYSAAAATTIPNGSAKTPATTITSTPGITISAAGLITATNNKTQNVTPTVTAGYVSSGTAGTITVSGSNTSQLSTQAAATISPTESEQTAVASGKYTTGIVKVGAISSNYVGSNIPQRTSSNLSASGSYIVVPSGYYAAQASKPVAAGSVQVDSPTISSTPAISLNSATGIITASNNGSSGVGASVTPGYVQSATNGTVTVSGSSSFALPTKSAATIIPSIADTTIASGVFLTGAQTIKGDSHLVGENIAAGASIFGINGSYTGSAAIITETVESGKTIVDIDTGDIYHWAGLNMEFVQDLGSVSWTLNDTTYADWTPATSAAKTIKSAVNVTTFSANMTSYEYMVLWHIVIDCAYDDGYTDTARFLKQYETLCSYLHRRPSTFANLDGGVFNGNVAINYTAYLSDYYNGSSTHTFAYQASYGFWMGVTAPTFSSSTSNTPTITVKSPSVSTRCSTTYFSTGNAAKINTTNTTLKAYAKLYRCPITKSFSYNLYKDLVDYRNLTERL